MCMLYAAWSKVRYIMHFQPSLYIRHAFHFFGIIGIQWNFGFYFCCNQTVLIDWEGHWIIILDIQRQQIELLAMPIRHLTAHLQRSRIYVHHKS